MDGASSMRDFVMGRKRGPHRSKNYPWARWFGLAKSNRGRLRLVQGKHYHGLTHGMVSTARQAAERHGLRLGVRIAADGRSFTIQLREG